MSFNQYEILYKFDNQGFSKIDHSGCAARIVLEQNEFSKKVTSNRDWTRDPTTLVAFCYSLMSSQIADQWHQSVSNVEKCGATTL